MAPSVHPAGRFCSYAHQSVTPLLSMSLMVCCACQREAQIPLYPVQGEVYVDAQPAEGALVVLHPLNENHTNGTPPRGFVDKNARYQLSTRSQHDGAPAGKYAVTVLWRRQSDEDEPGELLVPRHYLDPKESGLHATIVAGNNTLKAFHLTSE